MNAKELAIKFNPSTETISLFQSAIKAEALVKLMKETYEPVYEKIFAKYEFICSYDGTKITKPINVYLDADITKVEEYFKECSEVLNNMGYEKAKKGWCPILEAESLLAEANRLFGETVFNELMKIGVMKGIDYEQISFNYNNFKKFVEISKNIMFQKGVMVEA